MTAPLAVAAVAITALVCATRLAIVGHVWMAAAMVVVALVGTLVIGGSEGGA